MEFMGLGVGEWLAVGGFLFGAVAAFVNIKSTVAANSKAIEELKNSLAPAIDALKQDLRAELTRIEEGHAERFQAVEMMISATKIEADRQREKFENHRVEVAATYVTRDRLRESEATFLAEVKSIRTSLDHLSEKIWQRLEHISDRRPPAE